MRRTVLIVPGLVSEPDGDSFLRQSMPALQILSEIGSITKVAAVPASETSEAMLLGLGPSSVNLRQGPLTVSAFGFDPPERSTHFHLSLMSFDDGIASIPSVLPTAQEVDALMAAAKRLDTKLLTVLKGESLDHALVWESLGDMATTASSSVSGSAIKDYLPEGDGEVTLRRFIDDSVNLLTSLELNERRIDEGLPPYNILWPWGHGVRMPVPNLALRRGEPAVVESASLRLAGLTRLAGYIHVDRALVGRGLHTKLRSVAERAMSRELTIVYIDVPVDLRSKSQADELGWFARELDRELFQPLVDDHLKSHSRLTLIAPAPISPLDSPELPASSIGLALSVRSGSRPANAYPFDERSLEERGIPAIDLWNLVESSILI